MGPKLTQYLLVAALLLTGGAVFYLVPSDRNPCTLGDQTACVAMMREVKCPLIPNIEGNVQACFP